MVVSANTETFKYAQRPPLCWLCGLHSWWCGTRTTKSDARRRARCSAADKGCPGGSWTIYPANAYPHRRFSLSTLVAAVASVVVSASASVGPRTRTAAAVEHDTSRTSVTRWVRWVADLAEPASLVALCARLSPETLASSGDSHDERGRARTTLLMIDTVVDQLLARGVQLHGEGRGLPRLLAHQLSRFRDIFYVTVPCPRLRVDPRTLPP